MDLKSIRYFVHVADVGSITIASNDLGIVQPALSRQIKRLEDDAGVRFFDRLPRGVQLTPAGRIYLDHCRRILREAALAKEALAAAAGEMPGGHVGLGVPGTCAQMLVPRLVEKLAADYGDISLRVIEGPSGGLEEALLSGRVQVAILNNPSSGGTFQIAPLISELFAVYAPREPDSTRKHYTLSEIVGTPMVVTAGFRTMVDDQIRMRGKRLTVHYEVDSVEAIRRIILRGAGITILPVSTLRDDVEDGLLSAFPIAEMSMHRMLALAHLRTQLTPAAEAVANVARAEMAALAAEGVFSTIPAYAGTSSARRLERG